MPVSTVPCKHGRSVSLMAYKLEGASVLCVNPTYRYRDICITLSRTCVPIGECRSSDEMLCRTSPCPNGGTSYDVYVTYSQ